MNDINTRRLRLKAAIFVLLTYGLSAGVDWSFLQAMGGVMWAPGISALVVQLAFERRLRGLGWRLPKARWLLAGLAFPFAYVVLAYATAWTTGAADLIPEPLAWIREILQVHIGLPVLPEWLLVPAFALAVLTLAMAMSLVAALGEEIGWRGLLQPSLQQTEGFWRASLVTGFIWAAWHWHAIVYGDYNAGGSLFGSVVLFSAMIMLMSIGMAWLTLRSGSLWPAVVVHAAHNAFIQGAFEPLTRRPEQGQWVTGEWGVAIPVAIIFVLAMSAWTLRLRAKKAAGKRPA